MALDSKACYIGVAPRPSQASFNRKNQYTTWATAQAATDTYQGDWPLYDGAFTPDFILSGGSLLYFYGVTTPQNSNSNLTGLTRCLLYALDRLNTPGFSMPSIATADGSGNYYTGGTGLSISAGGPPETYLQSRIMVDLLTQSYWRLYFAAQIGYKTLRECVLALVQELPYNQELVSYERGRTGPTITDIKTMDGATRRYVTGPSTTTVRATFKWSDNGTIAAALDAIFEEAITAARPIVLYVPSGTYYNGPFLDLVIPTNTPTVIMPAPGVYETTIEGVCQP